MVTGADGGPRTRRRKMKAMTRSLLVMVMLCVCLAILAGCGKRDDREEFQDYTIVAMINMTGSMSPFGDAKDKSLRAAASIINRDGGVNGRKIAIHVVDTRSNPNEALTAYRRVVRPGETVIMGPPTPMAMAIAPMIDSDKVLMFATSGHPDVSKPAFAFRAFPSSLTESIMINEYSADRGYRRLFVLHTAEPYGLALAGAIEAEVKHMESYAPGERNFRNILSKLNQSDFDALVLCGFGLSYQAILAQLVEFGWQGPVISNLGGANLPSTDVPLDLKPSYAFIGPRYLATAESNPTPFVTHYREIYGSNPVWHGVLLADAVKLLANAVHESNSFDNDQVQKALLEKQNIEAFSGPVTVTNDGDLMYDLVFYSVGEDSLVTIDIDYRQ